MDPTLLLHRSVVPHPVDLLSGTTAQSCSENNLRFICEFKPGPGPLQVSVDEDFNVNMDSESVSVILPAQCSVYQLRLRICIQVGKPLVYDLLFKFALSVLFLKVLCIFKYIHMHSWSLPLGTS